MADYFDRNRSCRGWNQSVIQNQTALVLGVGGLGNSLCMALCRLGFGKIIIIDKDIVEVSNLNRQILFTTDSIGLSKTECAEESLDTQHNLETEIVRYDLCALKYWDVVVVAARASTCIFNTIDHGDYFDYAVASLGRSLNIPVVDGGTDPVYGTLFSLTISKCDENEPCWGCFNELRDSELCDKLKPDKIQKITDASFIPPDPRDGSNGSNVYTATACAQFMVALMMEYLMPRSDQPVPDRIIYRLLSFDQDKFHCEKNLSCSICTVSVDGIPNN